MAALGCGHFLPCSALTDVLCLQRGAGAPEQWEVRGIKVMHQWLSVKEMGRRGRGVREKKEAKEIYYFNQSLKFVEVVLVSI